MVKQVVRVGTASWTDPSLIKSKKFYPRGCNSAEDRLRYYASHFPIVEVDSSYYAMPSRRNSELWAQRTPDDFLFNMKAFRLFTCHQTPAQAIPPDLKADLMPHFRGKPNIYYADMPAEILDEMWHRFRQAVEPLRDAGKLGALHFQFAPWVICGNKALDHILECADRLPGYTLAVEFRHQSWCSEKNLERTLAFEREHGLVNVIVDEPQGFTNSIPAVWEATNENLSIVRFHGKNAATWNADGKVASDRFNYDYSEDELKTFVAPIMQMKAQVLNLHAIFNNNYEDQGQRDAKMLQGLLTQGYSAGELDA